MFIHYAPIRAYQEIDKLHNANFFLEVSFMISFFEFRTLFFICELLFSRNSFVFIEFSSKNFFFRRNSSVIFFLFEFS